MGGDPDKINWLSIVKEKSLLIRSLEKIISTVLELKQEGNELYVQRKFKEAGTKYKQAIDFLLDTNPTSHGSTDFDECIPTELKVKYLHSSAVVYSNAMQVELKLDRSFTDALIYGVRAKRRLSAIKALLDFDETAFEERFGTLEHKVRQRVSRALDEVGPIRFAVSACFSIAHPNAACMDVDVRLLLQQ